jgi:hypothetical protein
MQTKTNSVVHQLEITPKALANFSPGFERSREPWGKHQNREQTLKGLGSWRTLSGFICILELYPGLSLRSNSGLRLANAFGVIFQTALLLPVWLAFYLRF